MRKRSISNFTYLNTNKSYVGEPIERVVARITQNQEPIDNVAPMIYTERNDGVRPEYDIRTDRFEIAREAMDAVSKSQIAKRKGEPNKETEKTEPIKTDSGGEEKTE